MSGLVSDNISRASGLVKAATVSGGKVLQVVQGTSTTALSTSSTSFVDITSVEIAITPSASTSKVLVMCHSTGGNSGSSHKARYTIDRDGTNLGTTTYGFGAIKMDLASAIAPVSITYLDSPSSTSELVYTMQALVSNASSTAKGNHGSSTGCIICMEIGV
tara:strand:+ start:348 stop:830 length:483 start_codon:yes stop_codon:yes gene_type:complete